MRVLITVPWGERLGGAEAMLQTLLDGPPGEDPAGDLEIELVFLQDGSWPRRLRRDGFRVELVEAGRLRSPLAMARAVLALGRILRRRRPDLILSWMPKAHLYTAPAAVLVGKRRRLAWWQHEIVTGHWMDRLATVLPTLAVGCCSQAAADAQQRLRPRRRTFVAAPGVAGPPGELAVPGEAPPPGAAVMPPAAAAAPDAATAAPPVVGLVGRLQPWKGQDRLLRAQVLLREHGVALRTLIVGGDAHGLSSEYAAALPALVQQLGLADVTTLTGQVADAGPLIERMDVLVNASDPEPFGLVLLEAMARGVAVVAVDSGGPAEIVQDGRSGVLARSGEPAALAEAIGRLLADPALRATIAEEGQRRWRERYTDAAMRERLHERLRALAEQAGR